MSAADRLGRIDDYLTGVMSDADAEAHEEELFADAARGENAELAFLDRFKTLAGWFAPRGGFIGGATRAQIDALLASPIPTHYFEIAGPETSIARWPDDIALVAFRVSVDLRGYEDVDVTVERPSGDLVKVFRDVQCDPADGAVYGVCDEALARRAFFTKPCTTRVEGTRAGKRETIASFAVRPAAAR